MALRAMSLLPIVVGLILMLLHVINPVHRFDVIGVGTPAVSTHVVSVHALQRLIKLSLIEVPVDVLTLTA